MEQRLASLIVDAICCWQATGDVRGAPINRVRRVDPQRWRFQRLGSTVPVRSEP